MQWGRATSRAGTALASGIPAACPGTDVHSLGMEGIRPVQAPHGLHLRVMTDAELPCAWVGNEGPEGRPSNRLGLASLIAASCNSRAGEAGRARVGVLQVKAFLFGGAQSSAHQYPALMCARPRPGKRRLSSAHQAGWNFITRRLPCRLLKNCP